ncbi:MAG: hypothetical protein CEE43_15720 [Promethearchaeota archaeon Loki_b32]|nr:MAG: hypothetical protein CEE43_15720 [Candidatus Lokiarchaeota archaeon Loki_b32]
MVVKKKLKVTRALLATSFLIGIIAIVTPVIGCGTNGILIIAKGDDGDIAGATTSIIAMIEFDKASGLPSVAQVKFQTKIYDESGEKIYSMKGKLKDGLVISDSFQFYCAVREVTWINLLLVMGEGVIKTTDADLEIEYRGETITLPNTEGQYLPFSIWMMVNPKGEYVLGEDPEVFIWPQGGWATAIIVIGGIPTVGVVTYLTKYMEKMIP